MKQVAAIFHRTKEVNVYPIEGDRFLIEAFLQDEIHDVHAEVEILHPSLQIVAARFDLRNGPFTGVCKQTHPRFERLVGMTIGRGFTAEARKTVAGPMGCHRAGELVTEIAQAAYQLHFVRFFASLPPEVRQAEDVPELRRKVVLDVIPGMANTCFSYNEANDAKIADESGKLRIREQVMPTRDIG